MGKSKLGGWSPCDAMQQGMAYLLSRRPLRRTSLSLAGLVRGEEEIGEFTKASPERGGRGRSSWQPSSAERSASYEARLRRLLSVLFIGYLLLRGLTMALEAVNPCSARLVSELVIRRARDVPWRRLMGLRE